MEKRFLLKKGILEIPCKMSVPDGGDVRRVVLGVHGLGGSTCDEIQTGIAEEMKMFSCATFRFDFPAHGESSLDSEYFTLENCLDSLYAVACHAKKVYPDVEDLCIFATGFGAYITLVKMQDLMELPGRIKLVVQTPSVMLHETLLAMSHISRPTFQAMERVTFKAERPFDVTYSFYEEVRQNDVMTSYPLPMLILHGEEDAYIRNEDILNFRRLNERSKLVIVPGTSHRFLEEGAWDMVLDLTRDWFEFEQVLLSDWS